MIVLNERRSAGRLGLLRLVMDASGRAARRPSASAARDATIGNISASPNSKMPPVVGGGGVPGGPPTGGGGITGSTPTGGGDITGSPATGGGGGSVLFGFPPGDSQLVMLVFVTG